MKNVIKIAFMLLPLFSLAQKYEYGAANGMKLKGEIIINDSTTTISTLTKEGMKSVKYNTVKIVNGITYFTDGVMMHYFTISDMSGIARSYKYTKMVVFNMDSRQGGSKLIYYANQANQ